MLKNKVDAIPVEATYNQELIGSMDMKCESHENQVENYVTNLSTSFLQAGIPDLGEHPPIPRQ